MMFSGGEGDDGDQQATAADADPPTASSATTDKESSDKQQLGTYNPLRLAVLKLGFTELRWTSPLNYEKRDGAYNCANCGTALFDAAGKYDSGSGWPSFFRTAEGNVAMFREFDGRVECRCGGCGGHLGHIFPDGPRRVEVEENILDTVPKSALQVGDPNNANSRLPRYCMNGAALKFEPRQR